MKTLVTGATGFIGRHVTRKLIAQGASVNALCRRGSVPEPSQRMNVYPGDILDPGSVRKAMDGCDTVVHIAGYARNWARDPVTYRKVNVDGTRTILTLATELSVRKVVCTSSNLTMNPSSRDTTDESTPRSTPYLTEYEESKALMERVVEEFASKGLHVCAVNPSRVFGPGLLNEGNSVTRMISWFLDGRWRIIPGDGRMVGNYAFVDDIAKGHVLALDRGSPGERYILGGENVSFNDFFQILSDISHCRHRMVHVPGSLALFSAYVQVFGARLLRYHPMVSPEWTRVFLSDWACSSRKAIQDLGYTMTPFREGLQRTVEWLRSKNRISDHRGS